jgi:hypothetical protein
MVPGPHPRRRTWVPRFVIAAQKARLALSLAAQGDASIAEAWRWATEIEQRWFAGYPQRYINATSRQARTALGLPVE